MKIRRLEICNFMAINHAVLKLDDRRLVLVSGENKDDASQISNGSGKSSILDALSWCLYGITARDVTGDAVINRQIGKDCKVNIEIEDDGKLYSIVRYRKHSTGKNRLELRRFDHGAWSTLTAGTDKLTQAKVIQLIGCSADVFNTAVYIGQEQMPNLPAMTDKPLKLLIEEAAGINMLQAAYDKAKERLSDIETAHIEQIANWEALDNKEAFAVKTFDTTMLRKSEWDHDHDLKIKREASDLRDRKKRWSEDKQAFAKRYPKGTLDIERAIEDAEAKINAVSHEQKEKKALEKTLRQSEVSEINEQAQFNNTKRELIGAKKAVDNVKEMVGKNCGECGKIYLPEDIDEVHRIAKRQLFTVVEETKRVKQAYAEKHQKTKVESDKLKRYVDGMTDIKVQTVAYNDAQKDLRKFQSELEQLEQTEVQLRADMRRLKKKKAESNPFVSLLEEQQQQLTDIRRSRQAARDSLIITEKKVKLAIAVTKVYAPSGVRAHILDTVTPFLNDRTATYLTQLSDGNIKAQWSTLSQTSKGETRERFKIEVESSTGAATFKGLSGGEKRKVRLSCSMALQDLVASRASKPIELYVCDEIDDAIDDAGLERLMDVLETKARERGTVLVVSHNDLASWINQEVKVVKEHGMATVTGSALS